MDLTDVGSPGEKECAGQMFQGLCCGCSACLPHTSAVTCGDLVLKSQVLASSVEED